MQFTESFFEETEKFIKAVSHPHTKTAKRQRISHIESFLSCPEKFTIVEDADVGSTYILNPDSRNYLVLSSDGSLCALSTLSKVKWLYRKLKDGHLRDKQKYRIHDHAFLKERFPNFFV